ncbi:flagellar motor switch protein FliM [Aeromonas australiensis]|nr:flagellar motor switch protein FliM [Aeromonas australiensis]
MAQLFNNVECELSCDEFVAGRAADVDSQLIWVEAVSQIDHQRKVYFSIAPQVIYRLAVLFFGGTLSHKEEPPVLAKGISDTEQRLLLRLCQYQTDIWCAHQGLGDLQWQLQVVPYDALPGCSMWMSRIGLQAGNFAHSWQMWLLPQEESPSSANLALPREQLEQTLAHVPVRLRIVMGQLSMTLADLECLKVGDVLALELPEVVPALIGNRSCFNGRIAEHKGSLVYQVATVVEE